MRPRNFDSPLGLAIASGAPRDSGQTPRNGPRGPTSHGRFPMDPVGASPRMQSWLPTRPPPILTPLGSAAGSAGRADSSKFSKHQQNMPERGLELRKRVRGNSPEIRGGPTGPGSLGPTWWAYIPSPSHPVSRQRLETGSPPQRPEPTEGRRHRHHRPTASPSPSAPQSGGSRVSPTRPWARNRSSPVTTRSVWPGCIQKPSWPG